jgi:hypothetical protein
VQGNRGCSLGLLGGVKSQFFGAGERGFFHICPL